MHDGDLLVDSNKEKCGNYNYLALSLNSLELAHTLSRLLSRPPVGSHCLKRDRILSHSSTCSRLPELLYTRSFSLVHLLARTLSNSLELALTRLLTSWLKIARTRSLSLELSRIRSPCAAKPFSFHSLPSCYSSNE